MATVNQELFDRILLRAIAIERFKKGEIKKIFALYDEVLFPAVKARLLSRLRFIKKRGYDLGPATTRRLNILMEQVNNQITEFAPAAYKTVKKDLTAFAKIDAKWIQGAIESVMPVKLNLVTPSNILLNSIITSKPMMGKHLKDWWKGVNNGLKDGLKSELTKGLLLGESNQKIAKRWNGILGKTKKQTESLVRTAVSHVSNNARESVYRENDNVIKKVQYVATLDDRTTILCASLDGRNFEVDEGPRPPMHFQCRSTTVPVLRSWKELGIDAKELPTSTRRTMDGKVSEKTTFPMWLKKQPVAVQNNVLGKNRAMLFRKGKVSFSKFIDKNNNVLTLKQLAERV